MHNATISSRKGKGEVGNLKPLGSQIGTLNKRDVLSVERIQPENIRDFSELALRASMNYDRLEKSDYQPENLLNYEHNGWPGDKIGRTILGLVRLARATGRAPAFLDQIMEKLPKYLNKSGYFGKVQDAGYADEQQMGCHGWVIRAFTEYYNWKKDDKILRLLDPIINNLLLPAKDLYAAYPLKHSGISSKGSWNLSRYRTDFNIINQDIEQVMVEHQSDTGCAFIMLDGASHAYELFQRKDLKEVVETMINRFDEFDLLALNAQTHASLTAVRGILRFYRLHPEKRYLNLAKRIFQLYKDIAWTQAYGNYNWFGVPACTESCAIVDSFMVAMQLWENTLDWQYVEDAHHIYYNALRQGQRSNGGFGVDSCPRDSERELYVMCNEAHWCCTMRGAEGLADVIGSSVFKNDRNIYFPLYNNCTADLKFSDGKISLAVDSDYPIQGNVRVAVLKSDCTEVKKLHFYIPRWTDNGSIKIRKNNTELQLTRGIKKVSFETILTKGDMISVSFKNDFHIDELHGNIEKNILYTLRHGPMIIGSDRKNNADINCRDQFDYEGAGGYRHGKSGARISPVGEINRPMTMGHGYRVLFES